MSRRKTWQIYLLSPTSKKIKIKKIEGDARYANTFETKVNFLPHTLLAELRNGMDPFNMYIKIYDDSISYKWFTDAMIIQIENILDVFVLNDTKVHGKAVIVDYLVPDGRVARVFMPENGFPRVSEEFQRILKTGWGGILAKRDYPDAVKWLTAHNSLLGLLGECNPMIYGVQHKNPNFSEDERVALNNSWGVSDKPSFIRLLSSCMNGSTVDKWRSATKMTNGKLQRLVDQIEEKGGEICLWAHDYQRVIALAPLGYVCDWLTFDESVQWGVVAGQKLQPLFGNWHDFTSAYLLGICYFMDKDPYTPEFAVHTRKKIFRNRRNLAENPWAIPWDTPMKCVWTSRAPVVNEEGAKLPEGFRMLSGLHEADITGLADKFQGLLNKLISYIEEGGHTVEEIEVIMHCVIHEAISLEKTCPRDIAAIARSSFYATAARIFKHFRTGINAKALLALHES
jgi:hypothetical protein